MKKIITICFFSLCLLLFYFAFLHKDFFVYHFKKITDRSIRKIELQLQETLKNNPEQLFVEYRKELAIHPKEYAVCHGVLHQLGHQAFEQYGFSKAMDMSENLCGGGFIHGIIEAKFGTRGVLNPEQISSQLSTVCDSPNNQICYHGIGHGLMILFHNNIQKSLLVCDSVALPGQKDCYDGIFMHIFDNEETGIAKDIPEHSQGLSFCKNVSFDQKESCYFYAPRIFARTPHMVNNAIDACTNIDASVLKNFPKAKDICAKGSGHMFMKYMLPDYEKAQQACSGFEKTIQNSCLEGVEMYKKFNSKTSIL